MKTAAFSAAELRFWGWIPRAPDLSDFYAKGRGGLQPGASRDCRPPWGPPESRPRRWEFRTAKRESRLRCPDCFTAKRKSRLRRPGFATAKHESRLRRPDFFAAKRKDDRAARTSSRRSAKADNGGRLCPARSFFGRAAGRNGALPYNARKSQFLRNGDVWATESLFLFAVLWLAFLPGQSETGVAGGGKARRPETPAAPRRPRPTTATGSRFLRRQRERPTRRPRPSPPAREGSLGAPNDRTFPPGAERKARKEKGKEEPRMNRAPPL